MAFKKEDKVRLTLSKNEVVSGEIVDPDAGFFAEPWTITALITEGGHPRYGQVGAFSESEVEAV